MATLEDYQYDEMSSIDLIEDVENKMEDLITEKIEIITNIFKLRFTTDIDEQSMNNITSFMLEVMNEATNEQIVLNKLYDYLMQELDKYGYERLENSKLFLEYINLLSYFDDIEDQRTDEYMSYVERIGQLVRSNSINHTLLPSHRKYEILDKEKTNLIYSKVPETKK